jgi:hypothetical protein
VAKFLCVLLFATAARAQVEGTVADSVTGAGIPGVSVLLDRAGKTAYTATTDAKGDFLIEDVQAGAYVARYSAPNYRPQLPRAFQVSAGIPLTLQARLLPLSRVSGRVVDARGEGLARAWVQLSAPGSWLAAMTDSKGKFSIRGPFSGAIYRLCVQPPPGLKPPDPDPASGQTRGWAPTCYPGVTTPEAAAGIAMPPGGEVADLDFKLLAAAAHPVRGVLLKPDGTPAPKVRILVSQESTPSVTTESGPDGTFEFPVVDGEWRIAAELAGDDGHWLAAQWIEMAGHEIEDLKLRLYPPFTVSGKAIAETPPGAPQPEFPLVILSDAHLSRLHRASFPEGSAARPATFSSGRPGEDGVFYAGNVYPGLYRIFPTDPPPGYYLDAIRFGETERTAAEVEISSGGIPITLVYKTNGGVVRGTAEDCASGGVLLVPFDAALRRPGFFANGPCDANDRYQVQAVRPGDYYALAFPGNNLTPWYAASFDDTLLRQSARVTVRAGEAASADLRAVASQAYR